ncbi:hypothetical protein BC941DRAFT_414488 [Chlamydoabsidia padenii]|nr:hypothetical protein BC941DRAFT_414488 [Chlamydoabsidia padenii]
MKGGDRITVVDQDLVCPPTPNSQDSFSYNGDTNDNLPVDSVLSKSNIIEEGLKQRVLFALRFGSTKDIDWALNYLLDLTFTTPHHLPISTTPMLLELLLDHGRPYIKQQEEKQENDNQSKDDALSSLMDMDTGDDTQSTVKWDRLKKVLHVIRNYSTMEFDAMKMATHELLKDLIIKTLEISLRSGLLEIGRYSIDIVDKMASHIPLAGPGDPWIPCLTQLIYSQDRYLVVASIRALTVIGMCDLNQLFLANNTQVISCIAQNLLAVDEEMVGVSLEYLYQQVCISAECKSQMLSAYDGAYVGLLVDKVQSSSKYYVAKLIKEDSVTAATTPTNNSNNSAVLQPLSPSGSSISGSSSGTCSTTNSIAGGPISSLSLPGSHYSSVPDLTSYTTLDEPFRCLGWLKDNFEVTDSSTSLSLDDMYMLYYSRFGTEKALKMNHFYSVLTIAFPEQPPTHIMEKGQIIPNPSTRGTKIQGLHAYGLQIKMNILHSDDKSPYVCQWKDCTNNIHNDRFSLENHILHDHSSSTIDDNNGIYVCQWTGCTTSLESKDDWTTHTHEHAAGLPSPSLLNKSSSSSPPSSPSSPASPLSHPDDNEVLTTDNKNSSGESTNITSSDNNNNNNNNNTTSGELKGIALVAIHLLRSLSEDPSSPTYLTPYEIKLINAAENKPSLSQYVYSILSNIRFHSATPTPTSL